MIATCPSPYQGNNILDVLRLYAGPYTRNLQSLAAIRAWFSERPESHPIDRAITHTMLMAMEPDIDKLPLSKPLRDEFNRLLEFSGFLQETPEDNKTLGTLVQAFSSNLESAMGSIVCLVVDESRRELYEQTEPPFGPDVASKLSDANYDIAAASRCLALEEWTASVFHSTRILEIGLRDLAGRLKISDVRTKDWYKLIGGISSKIKELKTPGPGKPLKASQRRRIEWLSEMAAGFTYFKDAWRNPVSHSRGKYDEREATDAWNHIRSFMHILVRGPR